MSGGHGARDAEDVVHGQVGRQDWEIVGERRAPVGDADGRTHQEGGRDCDEEPGHGEDHDDHSLFLVRTIPWAVLSPGQKLTKHRALRWVRTMGIVLDRNGRYGCDRTTGKGLDGPDADEGMGTSAG